MKLHKANTNGSISVLIPADFIKELNWNVGDIVNWEYTEDDNTLILKRLNKPYKGAK